MRAHAFHMETPRARGGLTFFHSAATCLHSPAARRAASRQARRGSAGPANGTWSAAVKSWAALTRERLTFPASERNVMLNGVSIACSSLYSLGSDFECTRRLSISKATLMYEA